MYDMITFLSGGVPGGLLLLLFLLIVVNLSLQFFSRSGLFSKDKKRKKQLSYSLIILFLYASVWFYLRPPLPQQRIIILPTVLDANDRIDLSHRSFDFTESFQNASRNNLTDRYILHRWEWLAETIGTDSLYDYELWKSIATDLEPGLLVQSRQQNDQIRFTFSHNDDGEIFQSELIYSNDQPISKLLTELDEKFGLFKNPISWNPTDPKILDAKILMSTGMYEQAEDLISAQNDTSGEAKVLQAKLHFRRGLSIRRDREKAKYVKIRNEQFDMAKRLLYPMIKQRFDHPLIAYLLGRIALREEDFTNAEIFLKKSLVDDITNARTYYALSFLLPVRLSELGYASRTEVLEKAVYFDPAYRDAVFELANAYYLSGTGTQTGKGTTLALQTIRNYLEIRNRDVQILSLLGSIYIKTNKFDEAESIFTDLLNRFPNDSNLHYDVGIVKYHKKEFDNAIQYFKKAIEIDNNADAYIYLAVINRELGDRDKALFYYRERVRLKSGDDDHYAKEAMTGIRKILLEIEDEQNEK